MVRSICMLSRSYPPDAAGEPALLAESAARSLAGEGVAVHVISRKVAHEPGTVLQADVAVHRIDAPLPASSPEIEQAAWAAAVAEEYRRLDELVRFDAVLAPEAFAESLKVVVGPHTALVVQLLGSRAVLEPGVLDPRQDPSAAVAAYMELAAVRRADAVVAPSDVICQETKAHLDVPVTVLAPPLLLADPSVRRNPGPRDRELVQAGALEPRTAPELSLACLAELTRRGVDARLTFVGHDTATGPGGQSYRRSVLLPRMTELGLDFGRVRFVEDPGASGLAAHLCAAHALLVPSLVDAFCVTAARALVLGVPVVCSDRVGLRDWVSAEDGVAAGPPADALAFARAAAERLEDASWLATAGSRGAERVRELFDPRRTSRAYLALLEGLPRAGRLPAGVRRPARPTPKLGVLVHARGPSSRVHRTLQSLLFHTELAMRLVLVARSDLAAALARPDADPRLTILPVDEPAGPAAARNLALDALDGDEDYVVFLDGPVEVLAEWWKPYVGALEADPRAGMAGDDGHRWQRGALPGAPAATGPGQAGGDAPERCDVLDGPCVVMRASAVARIGRFRGPLDGLSTDDDYALRAARVGEQALGVSSDRILQFVSDDPDEIAGMRRAGTSRALLDRLDRLEGAPSCFFAFADADEVLADGALLAGYARAFTVRDDVALVVYGPGRDPGEFARSIHEVAAGQGLDLETGPKVLAILPPERVAADALTLAETAVCAVSRRRPTAPFDPLAVVAPGDAEGLRLLASRYWAARSAPVDRHLRRPRVACGDTGHADDPARSC